MDYSDITAADMVAAQETKLFQGDTTASAEDSLQVRKWRGRVQPCSSGPAGGPSAGVSVITRQHIGVSRPESLDMYDSNPRLQFQKVGAIFRGGFHLGSMYLHDMEGPTSSPTCLF